MSMRQEALTNATEQEAFPVPSSSTRVTRACRFFPRGGSDGLSPVLRLTTEEVHIPPTSWPITALSFSLSDQSFCHLRDSYELSFSPEWEPCCGTRRIT